MNFSNSDNKPNHGVSRIAVVRALSGLGDMLCIVPALRALRRGYPKAEITLVGMPQARFMLDRFQAYLDGLLEFPGFPGMPERQPQSGEIPAFFEAAHRKNLDLALQMHGSGQVMNTITALLGARRVAGFYLPGNYCPDPTGYLPYKEQEPEVKRYLCLLEHLGIPIQGEYLEFPLREDDFMRLAALPESPNLMPGNYACLHPGASVAERRWDPEGFAAAGDFLAAQGLPVVITGSAGEVELAQAVRQKMRYPALNLAGRTDLGTMAALLKKARLLVCNDTGVSHMAAALRLPSVVIFTGSDPQRWAPLDQRRHRVVPVQASLTREGAIRQVISQLEALLREERAYAA